MRGSSLTLEVIAMSWKERKTHPILTMDTMELYNDLYDRDKMDGWSVIVHLYQLHQLLILWKYQIRG